MAPKKKLSKKEKQKLAAEKAEQERIEMEKERQRLIQEEKERVERERLEAEEKAKRDVAEQNVRVIQLQATIALFKSYGKKMYKLKLENRANEEWIQYLKCDGLPDPASLGEMNTYLYLWRNCEERGILEDVVRRTGETLGLLEAMQELIDIPLNNTPEHVENWIQVRNDFRIEQQISLDRATYLILRRIEEKMNITNVSEVHYLSKFDHFILCLWSILPLPTPSVPLPNLKGRIPLECAFTEVGVNISLPDSLFDVLLAVRAMLVRYDHLSDLCPSWFPCPLPEDELKDLYEISLLEWEARCEFQVIVDEENERRAQIAARVAAIKPVSTQEDSRRAKKDKDKLLAQTAALEAEVLELQQLQQVPVKQASEMWSEKEDEIQADVKEKLQVELQPHELNLRKYIILGGVYHLDLIQQPPQPHELHNDYIFTVLQMPTELQPVDFHEKYVPPPPPEPGQRRLPEEIEAELKKQEEELQKLALASIEQEKKKKKKGKKGEKKPKKPKKKEKGGKKKKSKSAAESTDVGDELIANLDLEQFTSLRAPKKEEVVEEEEEEVIDLKLFDLGLVEIVLPSNVLWFEPPIVAGWNEETGYWTTEDFHDLKFNEDKQILTFRTGKFGPIGLAAYRYSNLPFQTWELKPNSKGEGVCFNLTAAVMILEFIIKDDKVCVNQLQNGATEALQEIVGNFYSPYQLRKVLVNGGVDLFPAHDAYCYIDGATPKHRAAEDHLYHCMAMFSTIYNFCWSRWNLLAGRRNIVLQMREVLDKKRQQDYSLLLVTPQKTCIIDCTEMSQSFSEESIEGSTFCSDLYHLILEQGSFAAKAKMNEIPYTLVETVFEMLSTTRVLSFS